MKNGGLWIRKIVRVDHNVSTVAMWWSGIHKHCRVSGCDMRTIDREEHHLRILVVRGKFFHYTSCLKGLVGNFRSDWLCRLIRSFGLHSYQPFLCLPFLVIHRARNCVMNECIGCTNGTMCLVMNSDFVCELHDERRVKRFRGERRNLIALARGVAVLIRSVPHQLIELPSLFNIFFVCYYFVLKF